MPFYYPLCFAKVGDSDGVCPACGGHIAGRVREQNCFPRLLHALHHPIGVVRVGTIVSLDKRGHPRAELRLAEFAYQHPTTVPQNLEITHAIEALESGQRWHAAPRWLEGHATRPVRRPTAAALTIPDRDRTARNA